MLFAQSRTVTGFVYDKEQKSPLQSVNVVVVGEYSGAVSKEDGSFEIQNISNCILFSNFLNSYFLSLF